AELLGTLAGALDPLPGVAAEIAATLVDAPPPHARLPGFIRPGRDREVDELRETARDARGWLARFEAAERQRTGIASLKVRHNKVFGYYVEVTRPNLPLVPPDYEPRQTLVGAERFVTPTPRGSTSSASPAPTWAASRPTSGRSRSSRCSRRRAASSPRQRRRSGSSTASSRASARATTWWAASRPSWSRCARRQTSWPGS